MFIWCLASWDVLGVYPESTTAQGSYYDAVVSQAIRQHNARARGVVPDGGGSGQGGRPTDEGRPPAAGR